MLQLQTRFHKMRGARALAFIESNRFRAAYDLLMLRARVGNAEPELARWWTQIQTLPPAEQRRELGVAAGGGSRRRRGGRRAEGSASDPHPEA